jgi:hypothetical protein
LLVLRRERICTNGRADRIDNGFRFSLCVKNVASMAVVIVVAADLHWLVVLGNGRKTQCGPVFRRALRFAGWIIRVQTLHDKKDYA